MGSMDRERNKIQTYCTAVITAHIAWQKRQTCCLKHTVPISLSSLSDGSGSGAAAAFGGGPQGQPP